MNLFFECKRCFWLRVNRKVKRPSGPFPSLPSGIDKKVKNHFDHFRDKEKAPPELEDLDLQLLKDKEFLEKARDWRREPKWRSEEQDFILRGGVDDLLKDGNKTVVMDYKTRGYPPKGENGVPDYYSRQVNLYNLILRENGHQTTDYGLILYFYPEKFTESGEFVFNTEIRRTKVDMKKAKKMVKDAVNTLEGDIPDHDNDCDFCGWNDAEH